MATQAQYDKLIEDNEIAFFRADVCLGSPESYSLEEKAAICEDMETTNKAIEDAIRKDFEALPPELNCLPLLGHEKWEALLWLEALCTTLG